MTEDDVQQIRRNTLSQWIKTHGGARSCCVKRGLGKSVESHISQIVRGYSFGARAARNLETKLGIPHRHLEGESSDLQLVVEAMVPGEIFVPCFELHGKNSQLLLRDQIGVIRGMQVSHEWLVRHVPSHTGVKNLRILTCFGDSMRPMFNSGDPLLIDVGQNTMNADAVYFLRVGSEGFVNQLQNTPGQGLRVLSLNKAYEPWAVKPDMDFEVLGRVIKAWSSQDF